MKKSKVQEMIDFRLSIIYEIENHMSKIRHINFPNEDDTEQIIFNYTNDIGSTYQYSITSLNMTENTVSVTAICDNNNLEDTFDITELGLTTLAHLYDSIQSINI